MMTYEQYLPLIPVALDGSIPALVFTKIVCACIKIILYVVSEECVKSMFSFEQVYYDNFFYIYFMKSEV